MFSSNTSQVASIAANYIEEVFSTHLYTGNGATQTINNGIDLAGKGGLVWIKDRTTAQFNLLFDTARGANNWMSSNTTNASAFNANMLQSFNSNGFGVGSTTSASGSNYASWTFRKQPKFFDVVTYTGNGAGPRIIFHNLGSTPGCTILKKVSTTSDWAVNTTRNGVFDGYKLLFLNSTAAEEPTNASGVYGVNSSMLFVGATPYAGTNFGSNDAGVNYVVYIFAHDAGGFGESGTDNVISCGSFTADASGSALVGPNLGWEPQWVLLKNATSTASGDWWLFDNMRGFTADGGGTNYLLANSSGAAGTFGGSTVNLTATGFTMPSDAFAPGQTFIYIAIRRGPMKVPTDGTKVFSPNLVAGYPSTITTNFPVDLVLLSRTNGSDGTTIDRLRGSSRTFVRTLKTTTTDSEGGSNLYGLGLDSNVGYYNNYSDPDIWWNFRRAPGFFDVVCYTGNSAGSNNQNHNLGVVPEMCILKARSGAFSVDHWQVVHKNDGVTAKTTALNLTNSSLVNSVMSDNFTSTFFKTTDATWPFTRTNFNGDTYVAYLFATCAGVSKVGSYTGNGTSQTIPCGFAAGARFVMIKRTDSTGDWYVWDTARGIIAGNDPHTKLNIANAAQVTTDDTIDPASSGFIVNQVAATNVNVTAATYIFLAIA